MDFDGMFVAPAEAEANFLAATQLDPDCAMYAFYLARSRQREHAQNRVLDGFERAIRLGLRDPKCYFALGKEWENACDHEEAARAYQSAVELQPEDLRYQRALAEALAYCGNHPAAEVPARAAVALSNEGPAEVALLARVLRRQKRYEEASQLLHGGLETCGESAQGPLLCELGNLTLAQGDPRAAHRYFRLAADTGAAGASFGLGQCLRTDDGFLQQAARALEAAVAEAPKDIFARGVLAEVYERLGLDREAERVALLAMALNLQMQLPRQVLQKLRSESRAGPALRPGQKLAPLVSPLLARGRYQEALLIYLRAIEQGEESRDHYAGAIDCLLREGAVRDADVMCFAARIPDEEHVPLRIQEAQILAETGNPGLALRLLKELTQEHPQRPEAHAALSVAHRLSARGTLIYQQASRRRAKDSDTDFLSASTASSRACELAPKNIAFALDAGSLFMELGQISEAEAAYRAASALEAQNPRALVGLAGCLVKQARVDEAETLLRKAVELDASCGAALAMLARLCLASGRLAEAQRAAEAASKTYPQNHRTQGILGLVRQSQGDFTAAEVHLDMAINLLPKFFVPGEEVIPLYSALASVLSQREEHDAALDLLDQAIARDPADVELRLLAATVHDASLGDDTARPLEAEEGRHHAEIAVCLAPQSSASWRVLARLRLREGSYRAAFDAVAKAHRCDAGDTLERGILDLMADAALLFEERLCEEALERWGQVLQTMPERPVAWIGRGNCHLELDDWAAAERDFLTAAALAPTDPQPQLALSTLYTQWSRQKESDVASARQRELEAKYGNTSAQEDIDALEAVVAEQGLSHEAAGSCNDPHTMTPARLDAYCVQRVPVKEIFASLLQASRGLYVVPALPEHFLDPAFLSLHHITDVKRLSGSYPHAPEKRHNCIRPVLYEGKVGGDPALLYAVSPGASYVKHQATMLEHVTGMPWKVLAGVGDVAALLKPLHGMGLNEGDTVILGAVGKMRACLQTVFSWDMNATTWHQDNELFSVYRHKVSDDHSLVFLGVKFSYWGDLAGELAAVLAEKGCPEIVYCAKLGALTNAEDLWTRCFSPTKFLIYEDGLEVASVEDVPNGLSELGTQAGGVHASVPTMLEERRELTRAMLSRGVETIDNEMGYIARAISRYNRKTGSQMRFTPLHYATDLLELDPSAMSLGLECSRDELLAVNKHVAVFRQAYALDCYVRGLRGSDASTAWRTPLEPPGILVRAETMRAAGRVILGLPDEEAVPLQTACASEASWSEACAEYVRRTVKVEELALLKDWADERVKRPPEQRPAVQQEGPMATEPVRQGTWSARDPAFLYDLYRTLLGAEPLAKFSEVASWPHETREEVDAFVAECHRILRDECTSREAEEMGRRAVAFQRTHSLTLARYQAMIDRGQASMPSQQRDLN